MRGNDRSDSPVRLEKKHPLAIRWFHWVNFPVLGIMVWSGLLIYWANRVYHLGPWKLFPDSLYNRFGMSQRLAEGMGWHFFFMWLFILNGIAYVLYTAISGEWRHLLPRKGSLKGATLVVLHDLRLTRRPLPPGKYNDAQRIAYTLVVLMGLGSLVTGLAVYKPTQASWLTGLFGGYPNARFVHFWLTMGYVLFFLVHLAQVIRAGWNNFRAMITGHELVPDES